MWSNADEVNAFIEDHKGGRWGVGDRCVLPDIEQPYTVVAVRPFSHRGKFRLFVDLEAPCAVVECQEYLVTTKEVHQWMSSPHLTRCCVAHKYGFSTGMVGAWKTAEQRAGERERLELRGRQEALPHVGLNERAVLEALEAVSLVGDQIGVEHVVSHAVALLPPAGRGGRDTRRQRVVRAIGSLAEAGRITLRGGAVLL
jgi:hypothetical protein